MPSTFQTLAVVVARAGSQGVPSKHLRNLLGRPVINYALDHALSCPAIDRVVVSTDCPQIKALARRRFVQTVNRPAELATSDASVQDALLHALADVKTRGYTPDAVACIYGNVPVRPEDGLQRGIEKLYASAADSVRSFVPVGKFHPGWMNRLSKDGVVEQLQPGSVDRRQNLEPLFVHDGSVLVMTRHSLERGLETPGDPHAMFGIDRRGIEIPAESSVEIDSERDLLIAEASLRSRGVQADSVRMAA